MKRKRFSHVFVHKTRHKDTPAMARSGWRRPALARLDRSICFKKTKTIRNIVRFNVLGWKIIQTILHVHLRESVHKIVYTIISCSASHIIKFDTKGLYFVEYINVKGTEHYWLLLKITVSIKSCPVLLRVSKVVARQIKVLRDIVRCQNIDSNCL